MATAYSSASIYEHPEYFDPDYRADEDSSANSNFVFDMGGMGPMGPGPGHGPGFGGRPGPGMGGRGPMPPMGNMGRPPMGNMGNMGNADDLGRAIGGLVIGATLAGLLSQSNAGDSVNQETFLGYRVVENVVPINSQVYADRKSVV